MAEAESIFLGFAGEASTLTLASACMYLYFNKYEPLTVAGGRYEVN